MEIVVQSLNHIYLPGTPMARHALRDINLRIGAGEKVAVVGQTGSGKSTLIQHFNGLLKPTTGLVQVGPYQITPRSRNLRALRQVVGMLFQYPEYQLFESTVERDVAYGPRQMGWHEERIKKQVSIALRQVGLDDSYLSRSPLMLSGGEKRRVALAGVLSMDPQVLILDEPTAGLDPRGRREILSLLHRLHKETGITLIMVTHSMEEALFCDRILVMKEGRLCLDGSPHHIFQEVEQLRAFGLDLPEGVKLLQALQMRLGFQLQPKAYTAEEIALAISAQLKRRER